MIPGRVSVIIPANNERHLPRTIQSVLREATGDVEVFACLDELDRSIARAIRPRIAAYLAR
jgi:glycosyltransferase involved in cell wall biosynthesis